MLQKEIIEPANTEWDHPIAFSPKNHGLLRLFAYYGKLNAVTVRDLYPFA